MADDTNDLMLLRQSYVLSLVEQNTALQAEIERLRRLGDTLAHHVRAEEAKEMYSAVNAWEEARRG